MNILAAVTLWFVFVVNPGKTKERRKRDTTLSNVKAIFNRYVITSTGKATYYGEYPGGGACALDPLPTLGKQPGWIQVAAGKDDFQNSLGCGMCLEIRGSGKAAAPDLSGTTPVKGNLYGFVTDLCGSCKQGDLDLYIPGNGVWQISFKAIECPTIRGPAGYIQFRFTGSNEWYLKLQVRNTRLPVAGVEAFDVANDEWRCLTRTSDNHFSSEGLGRLLFPLKVRLTSIADEQLESTIASPVNDQNIPTQVQFMSLRLRGGAPDNIKCYGQGNRESTQKGDDNFCVGKEDGIYADRHDCTAFYLCSGDRTFRKFCPAGLKFNPLIRNCDDPENVNCQEQDQQKHVVKNKSNDWNKNEETAINNSKLFMEQNNSGLLNEYETPVHIAASPVLPTNDTRLNSNQIWNDTRLNSNQIWNDTRLNSNQIWNDTRLNSNQIWNDTRLNSNQIRNNSHEYSLTGLKEAEHARIINLKKKYEDRNHSSIEYVSQMRGTNDKENETGSYIDFTSTQEQNRIQPNTLSKNILKWENNFVAPALRTDSSLKQGYHDNDTRKNNTSLTSVKLRTVFRGKRPLVNDGHANIEELKVVQSVNPGKSLEASLPTVEPSSSTMSRVMGREKGKNDDFIQNNGLLESLNSKDNGNLLLKKVTNQEKVGVSKILPGLTLSGPGIERVAAQRYSHEISNKSDDSSFQTPPLQLEKNRPRNKSSFVLLLRNSINKMPSPVNSVQTQVEPTLKQIINTQHKTSVSRQIYGKEKNYFDDRSTKGMLISNKENETNGKQNSAQEANSSGSSPEDEYFEDTNDVIIDLAEKQRTSFVRCKGANNTRITELPRFRGLHKTVHSPRLEQQEVKEDKYGKMKDSDLDVHKGMVDIQIDEFKDKVTLHMRQDGRP